MRLTVKAFSLAALVAVAAYAAPAVGQVLYQQNFDVDDTANWTFTLGGGTDGLADYFYDYGASAGIPAAPGSAGTTRGMKLQANIAAGVFGGGSASPNGQSFTGDYKVNFDLWTNYIGAAENNDATPDGINPIGTTSGSTMLSTYGILTSGTFGNRAGAADGIFFANTGDASASGFRIYSSERQISYQLPVLNPETDIDGVGQPIDGHATYHAGNRSTNPASATVPAAQLYKDTFPPVTVPAAQTALFPETQFGTTQIASIGFDWHPVEIAKIGNLVTVKIEGVLFGTVDMTNYVNPPTGTNISFGHADVNAGISADPYYDDVAFTLIDNIVVTAVTATVSDADFDGDNDIDGADYLTWQRNLGVTGTGTLATGDANGDTNVNAADLAIWQTQFATATPVAGAVPEPTSAALLVAAALTGFVARRRMV